MRMPAADACARMRRGAVPQILDWSCLLVAEESEASDVRATHKLSIHSFRRAQRSSTQSEQVSGGRSTLDRHGGANAELEAAKCAEDDGDSDDCDYYEASEQGHRHAPVPIMCCRECGAACSHGQRSHRGNETWIKERGWQLGRELEQQALRTMPKRTEAGGQVVARFGLVLPRVTVAGATRTLLGWIERPPPLTIAVVALCDVEEDGIGGFGGLVVRIIQQSVDPAKTRSSVCK
mmetsp:Transcript_27815/g.74924  ORF Transcript_27815/g.74924 Transcript_27815/m.74924 type:complete len:235 (+) Transcript_27815:198-902(+)